MLGKLTKYEFKSTMRIFPLVYIGLIALATLTRIYGIIEIGPEDPFLLEFIENLTYLMYGLLIFGTCAGLLIVTIQRFTKNLLGDEGYLMFTLPVKSWQLVLSKILVISLWSLLSFIVVMLSAFIISGEDMSYLFREIANGISELARVAGVGGMIELIFALVLGLFSFPLPIFVSIAIGSLWRKHRTLGAFISFILLNIVTQTIVVNVMNIIFRNYEANSSGLEWAGATEAQMIAYSQSQMHSFMIPMLILATVFTAIYFFTTTILLDKTLDLE